MVTYSISVYNQRMTAYIRKVKSKSGATSVQIEYKCGRERTGIVHIGTAHNDAELKLLCALAHAKITKASCPLILTLRGKVTGMHGFEEHIQGFYGTHSTAYTTGSALTR